MIIGKSITKTFTGEPLLENIDFKVLPGLKIGVVGKNGCGKTTLFNIIASKTDIDAGSTQKQDEVIGYIPQEFHFPDQLVGEYLEKSLDFSWETYKIEALVDQLGFSNYDPYQEIKTLSEGQKMKLKMIEILLGDPTTLLIDEPTNHLDIEGILWFERYIKRLDKSVLMISHDRQFLNNTVDEIWEIEDKNLYRFVGDYDSYKEGKLKLIDKWDQEYRLFLKRKEKLEKLLENARRIKDGKQRGRAVSAAKKRIEREVKNNSVEKYSTKKMRAVEFDTDITHNKLMIQFDNVTKAYGDNIVFKDLSFDIRGGEKVWLSGPNGIGKTTLVKLIVGEEEPTAGSVKLGNDIELGYFAQKQTHLEYSQTLQEYFVEETTCSYSESFGVLRRFLFDKEDLIMPIEFLSPGQRARFAFALFAYKNYDLLILDEPTNHLDIETKEVIEDSLRDFDGTILLVSHDRFFVERIGMDRNLDLSEGVMRLE